LSSRLCPRPSLLLTTPQPPKSTLFPYTTLFRSARDRMRPPMKGGFTFFLIFNTLMEWLVIPAAAYFNWHLSQRRILIVAGALLYYAARVWTYLYFVSNIFEFMATSTGGPPSAELVNRVTRWVNLSWGRATIDGLTAVLFLVAASKAGSLRSRV